VNGGEVGNKNQAIHTSKVREPRKSLSNFFIGVGAS